MEKSNFMIHSTDRKGHELKISVEGTDDKELAHFGGLDLHVKATKAMIADISPLHFPEKEGDHLIREKVAALYLNEVGEFLRNTSLDPEMLESYSNFDLVKMLMEEWQPREVQAVIDKDNELILQEAKSMEEDNKIFAEIMEVELV
ncbi:hypothetical protein BTO30_15550 [Domibacillus antri]|uniref:Uncharacterized protein n=1 Tax=Domibacillus antri TaxID=1714264 RepID=A0A1Q8Q1W0_9BACI|nr:hypothetical protein [Domibacillus antri]OLN21324.1 hypothetical protein BTO30_15550 [Domibacillus antri]